ncbi:MAG: peroxidase [bacterium]|nr:peroxidase [bacterium]
MAWIRTIPDDQWDGGLEPLAAMVRDRTTGRIDNIMQIHSLNPASLLAHNTLYKSAMAGTATLRKVDRELIAYVVSQANDCHY